MSTFGAPSSSTPNPAVKLEIQDQSIDQESIFNPRPIIILSTHSLLRIMKMVQRVSHDNKASSSLGIPDNYMETVDVRDVINKARLSSTSSSRPLSVARKPSLWQFMRSPAVRLPYRPCLWSLLLKGLVTQAD